MEEFEGVMFDEGDFEVVDECEGEEDTPMVSETEKQTDDDNGEKSRDGSAPATKENTENLKQCTGASTPKISSGNGDDFTTDVSMDAKKGDADDDEVMHLDASDVLILDSKDDLGVDDTIGNDCNETDAVVEVLPPEHAWYAEKLTAKTSIFKERLTKLARVLELSYPSYKPWMDHSKTPLCHLDPPRRANLDKPHTNRWKFICSRKPVQESTNKEEDSADGTVNKKLETVWRLGPADGSGVNTDNASQYPPFVMRVVKVFEEFIQNIEQQLQQSSEEETSADQESPVDQNTSTDKKLPVVQETPANKASPAETNKDEQDAGIEEIKADDDFAEDTANDEAGFVVDRNHNWLWLLVRSNSKDELMIFATGKKISDSTMQKLKQTFETGPGKDCNVKSLYCKSIAQKPGSTATSNITFLVGSEALDETVGGLKIQLAPKTNFWCNAGGAEQLGAAVGDLLSPLAKTTLVEVGCGLGLIGLMLAPKCKQVIGLDAPSEVEEAEMTSELNKIKNSAFIMGQPNELMEKVTTLLKSTRAAAIVNGNTKLGRDIEVMTALRKIPSLRRVVMITTLTKQSVRAILELTRPTDTNLGNPFMPVRAVLVDTLPTGPHFEVVIRMERMAIHKMEEPWFWNHVKFRAGLSPNEEPRKNPPPKPPGNRASVQAKKGGIKSSATPGGKHSQNGNRRGNNRSNRRKSMKKQRAATQSIVLGKVTGVVRNPPANLVKNPMASVAKSGKNGQRGKRPHSPGRSNNSKKNSKPKSNEKPTGESPLSPDPLKPVKVAKSTKAPSTSPLKKNPLAKNSPGRGQRLSGAQKRKRHWAMVEAGRQGGQGSGEKRMRGNGNRGDLRGRLSDVRMDPHLMQQVQEQQMLLNIAQQRLSGQGPMVDVDTAKQLQNMLNIVLEQTNKLHNQLPRSVWDRIAPPDNSGYSPPQNMPPRDSAMFRDRFVQDIGPQDIVITTPNNEFGNQGPLPLFPGRPLDRTKILPAGMTPMENQRGTNTARGIIPERSQGRDHRKSGGNQANDWNRQNQNRGNQGKSSIPIPMDVVVRPPSPKRPLLSPPRVALSPPRRSYVPSFSQQDMRRPQSPPRRQNSPPRRQIIDQPRNNPHSEIFQRRPAALQSGRQQSSDLPRRGNSPVRREQTSGRSLSPSRRFGDDWDINRAMQQTNWNQREQQRSGDRDVGDKRWNERSQNPQNWDNLSSNERFRRGAESQSKDGTWMSGGGDVWNSKQMSVKPGNKDQWALGMDKPEWVRGGNSGPSGDYWNSRKESYGSSNNRMDNYRDGNKTDDLPDDAKDPWGDDTGGKSRWQQNEKSGSSNRPRDWSNNSGNSGNWQNKGNSSINSGKQMWPSVSNQNSNEQRWMSLNETPRNSMQSNNWQGSYGMNMRGQNYSGFSQQQRQNTFGSSFKDGR